MRGAAGLSWGLTLAAVLAGPWLFGAWEGWWFWPLAIPLFLGLAAFGAAWFNPTRLLAALDGFRLRRDGAPALAAFGLFLIYGAIRLMQTRVYADAERSVLLALLPFGTAVILAVAAGPRARPVLFGLLAVNLLALGLYGAINHLRTGSERVMWMPGFLQYIAEDRASGSYYCPNHFAGILELGGAMALGLMLDRARRWPARGFGLLLLAVCGWGVLLSRSRGGGLTLAALLVAAPLVGLVQWAPRRRWPARGLLLALLLAAAAAAAWGAGGYRERFLRYPWKELQRSDRIQMAGAALRAWKTAPWGGIGPGMHQNLWPHFAATPDGDRAQRRWPSQPNIGWHSYEVHSDWIQLLEEYGAVGLTLLLAALGLVGRLLWRGLRREEAAWRQAGWGAAGPPRGGFFAALLAGVLGLAAMGLHEAVDFNLQMPATGWMLGALLGLAAGEALRRDQ